VLRSSPLERAGFVIEEVREYSRANLPERGAQPARSAISSTLYPSMRQIATCRNLSSPRRPSRRWYSCERRYQQVSAIRRCDRRRLRKLPCARAVGGT
jgi:hypothetical protein